jgi:aryl-alcohol dehydrogenase-like predicted oxidoreductase
MELDQCGGPRLGFGCVSLGSASRGRSWKSDVRLVESAVDAGVTVFDTANAYGHGASEAILGRALRGRRSSVVVSTKVGYTFRERSLAEHTARRMVTPVVARARRSANTGAGGISTNTGTASYTAQDFSAAAINSAVHASLRRLQTDHIDVLHLHAPRAVLPDARATVETLVQAGKVRRVGIGAESLDVAASWLHAGGVDVVQVPFGVLDPEAAAEILPVARDAGADVWIRGVLGGGYVSLAMNEHRRPGSTMLRRDPKWPLLEELMETARFAGVTLSTLAMDYARSFADVSVILVGIHSDEHLSKNVAMMAAREPDDSLIEATQRVLDRWTRADESI